ncbi:hypothetical protein NPIL_423181 [Nephila pilipes]|uniref:Uncharacterized protein n=1 Tax=Nephila pilipes TaxID=299642 RepID=A0A8X6NBP8_NEPPI|nr:hypothetical protein NPIL_423181 [Nephila pilipes]
MVIFRKAVKRKHHSQIRSQCAAIQQVFRNDGTIVQHIDSGRLGEKIHHEDRVNFTTLDSALSTIRGVKRTLEIIRVIERRQKISTSIAGTTSDLRLATSCYALCRKLSTLNPIVWSRVAIRKES